VLGALELVEPGAGILPHERTTPKDKADRLTILRTVRANLSPIWGLSPATRLTELLPIDGAPDSTCSDEEGNRHSLWRITDSGAIAAISETVASEPVIVADGHHRYEVALAHRAEHGSGQAGGHDAVLAYVVELSEEQLSVRAIHRLLDGLPDDLDVAAALEPWFEVSPSPEAVVTDDALCLVTGAGNHHLRPRQETIDAAEHDLDSSRLDVALAGLPQHGVRFQHGRELVVAAVEKGEAQAGVLLRPARVEQITAIGRGGQRMPPKTTFFYPKPRTGLVFRDLERA
jgi:uncharacterized protein (DUF1015 family)